MLGRKKVQKAVLEKTAERFEQKFRVKRLKFEGYSKLQIDQCLAKTREKIGEMLPIGGKRNGHE